MMRSADTICNSVDKVPRAYRPMAPEIVMTSSFYFESFDEYAEGCTNEFDSYVYTRGTNPTTGVLEDMLAQLEGGECCKVFGSGMGAISAALLTFASQGDHVLMVNTVYGASANLIRGMSRYGITSSLVNSSDTAEIVAALRPNTKIIYFESPSSQKFEMVDLEAIAEVAHERSIITMIDNTWSTPLFQHPLAHGIDISIHSCSKYIGGHSDIVCGALIASRRIVREIEEFGFLLLGSTASPLTSFLAIRGLRSLPARMRTLEANARKVLDYLSADPRIEQVYHPYVSEGEQRRLAETYLSGYGSLLSFDMADGSLEKLEQFVEQLKLITLGVSWGGFESLVLPVYRRTNADAVRARGLDATHVRMYVGLEDPADIIEDLSQALDKTYGKI